MKTATASSTVDTHLASDRTIGRIEPVFEFHGAMPTGVTVSSSGRIFISFPRWGDNVLFRIATLPND
jgi:hypothetical protein